MAHSQISLKKLNQRSLQKKKLFSKLSSHPTSFLFRKPLHPPLKKIFASKLKCKLLPPFCPPLSRWRRHSVFQKMTSSERSRLAEPWAEIARVCVSPSRTLSRCEGDSPLGTLSFSHAKTEWRRRKGAGPGRGGASRGETHSFRQPIFACV